MRFQISQPIAAPVDEVVDLYCTPSFFTSLDPSERIATPQLVDHREDGDVVVMALRYRFVGDLPSAASRFVQADKLTWVETTTVQRAAARATSTLAADNYPQLLEASATVTFTSAGNRPADARPATMRTVDGTLRVKVPLVGSRVERAIVDGLREHLAAEAAAASAALDS
ncbi:MAG: DUF2505 family protein [Acidimicrobiia bacterium]|nr:DUF2505 family protein [Acidimicrobiia bacterium]